MLGVAYTQWRSERGQPIMVEKIEFVGYHKIGDKITRFKTYGDDVYQGETWKCKVLTTMETKEFTFKVKMISHEEEVGWDYTKPSEIPFDTSKNPIVDTWEVFNDIENRSDVPNKAIQTQEERQEELKIQLSNVIKTTTNLNLKKAAIARLNFISNPNLTTKRLYFDKIKPRYKKLLVKTINEVHI